MQQKLLNRLKTKNVLKISWWRMCVHVFLLQFKKREREKDEIVALERS